MSIPLRDQRCRNTALNQPHEKSNVREADFVPLLAQLHSLDACNRLRSIHVGPPASTPSFRDASEAAALAAASSDTNPAVTIRHHLPPQDLCRSATMRKKQRATVSRPESSVHPLTGSAVGVTISPDQSIASLSSPDPTLCAWVLAGAWQRNHVAK